jgi:hypothetical protein
MVVGGVSSWANRVHNCRSALARDWIDQAPYLVSLNVIVCQLFMFRIMQVVVPVANSLPSAS